MENLMHWYNPVTKQEEEVPVPMSEAQAIEMLSGHPKSDQFIEEYRQMRAKEKDIVKALIFTGERFYFEHQKGPPPG